MPDRPLLVTADPDLLDDLLRLSAAAGVEPEVAHDVSVARRSWSRSPLVVLGDDLSRSAVAGRLGRRRDVLLVGLDLDDASVWSRAADLGAEGVLFLPGSERLLVDRLTTIADGPAARPAAVVGVVGGRGGAGASTFACALAVTAAGDGRRTMLVDADPLGGGLDLVVGGEHTTGLRWPDLAGSAGRVDAAALRSALPQVSRLTLLSWDRGDPREVSAESARAVLRAAGRAHDLVVVDLPRRFDEVAEVALAESDVVLVVVPAEVRAVASAARVAARAGLLAAEIRVVVRGPSPSGLTGSVVAATLGLPLAGWLKPEPGLVRSLERGEPPARSGRGPLAELCRDVLGGLSSVRRPAA